MAQIYPKRLIEADLPIKWISTHALREKSIRHGHISTPLATYRAIICAALWLYPADELCSTPQVHIIRNLAHLDWKPIVKVEHYIVSAQNLLQAKSGQGGGE